MSARRARRLFGGPPLRHRLVFGRGMFSDDTEHAYLTALSLLRHPEDPSAFARSLAWRLRLWSACLPAGTGLATIRACLKLWLGFPPHRSGVFSAGNGPAMRAPILGACLRDHPELLREIIRASSRLTHTDPRADEGSWVVARAAAYAVARTPEQLDADAFLDNVQSGLKGRQLRESLEVVRELVRDAAETDELATRLGFARGVSGYINHTVPAVLFCWLRYRGDFRQTVERVVLLGGDADTTGAIVGALAGATVGAGGIAPEWRAGLWEWPCSVTWLRGLAGCLAAAFADEPAVAGSVPRPPRVFWPGVFARNVLFLMIVLAHGFRRLAPPY